MRWENVDRANREVRLFTSKNGEGRTLPLVGQLWMLIERRWAAREYGIGGVSRLAEFVFHDGGQRFWDVGRVWQNACAAAGLGTRDRKGRFTGKLFHDLRRTAVRNLVRAGVPQTVAMSISGHKTEAMFRRYNITSENDKATALLGVERRRG